MEITLVKVFPVHEDKLKAFVSIVIDNCFMVNDIKIIQGKDRLFLSMPSRRKKTGEFKDVAHPLNEETRSLLEDRVLEEYWRVVEEEEGEATDAAKKASPPEGASERRPNPGIAPDRPTPVMPPNRPQVSEVKAASSIVVAHPSSQGGLKDRRDLSTPPDGDLAAVASADGPMIGSVERQNSLPPEASELSLEEVQEKHLQDSFWSVR